MGFQGFLQAQKGDPDWTFTPEQYFEKKFKIIEASVMELDDNKSESIVLRQSPTEKELLAKKIYIEIGEDSTLDLTIINEARPHLQQVFIYDVIIHEGGTLNLGVFINGGKLNKHIFQVTLHSHALFNGYGHVANNMGGDSELITKTLHTGNASNSQLLFTTESGEDSQTVYQGATHISQECLLSQANIDVCNMVTGENGRCHSIPEIFNHSDSAKINCLTFTDIMDPEKIYYLCARGMEKFHAEKLLLDSHRNRTIDIISSDSLRNEITDLFN